MITFYESLSVLEKIYFICAMVGGLLFIIRMILTFIGGHHDADMGGDVGDFDAGHDFDGGHDVDHELDHDSDSSFKVLSLQSLTAFFMMFGLVGLALARQAKVMHVWSMMGAVAGGLGAIWVIGKIFSGMKHLQSDGTLDIRNAVGLEGSVYLTIPEEGEGKVQIAVQDSLRELPAVSKYKKEIKTGERIIVDSVVGVNILVVRKA